MTVSIGMVHAGDPNGAAHWPLATLRYNSNVMDSHWLARLAPKFKPSEHTAPGLYAEIHSPARER